MKFLLNNFGKSEKCASKIIKGLPQCAVHTVLMDPIEHFMLGNSPFMRYPYTQYMRPSGTVLGTPE